MNGSVPAGAPVTEIDARGTAGLIGRNGYRAITDVSEPHDDTLGAPSHVLHLGGSILIDDPDNPGGPQIRVILGASVTPVPEPGTIAMMLLALIGFVWIRRRA